MSKNQIFSKISKQTVSAYQEHLGGLKLSEATVKRRLSSIRRFCEWSYDEGYLKENPFITQKLAEKIQKITERHGVRFHELPLTSGLVRAYEQYQSISITKYLHYAILIIFCASLGFGAYDQFFRKAPAPLAYPPASALVTPNRYLSFQGRLTDSSDNPITTSTSFRFALYNSLTASGSAQLWEEQRAITPDQDGIFSVILGTNVAIPTTVFTDNASIWLGVTVNNDPGMTPRQQIATVGYALNAETLQGIPPSASPSANKIPIITQSGDLVLAGASPRVYSTSGTFGIKGQALSITTDTGTNGNITLAPDGTGVLNINLGGASGNQIRVTDANITSGSLVSAYAGTNVTGYDLLNLSSGDPETEKFAVDYSGDVSLAGGDITGANSVILDIGEASSSYITSSVGFAVGGGTTYYLGSTGTLNVATINAFSLAGNITVNQDIDIIPAGTTGTNDLGSATYPWDNLYANNIVAPGTGVFGYWQRNLGTLSPTNITDDLLIGGTATSSAKFQVLGTGASAGTVKIVAGQGIDTLAAGTLTIGGTTQTGLTLGRSAQSTTLAGNVQAFTLAGTITGSSSPNITSIGQFSGVTGVFSTSASSPTFQGNSGAVTFGNASYATTIAGSSTLTINPTSWTTTPTISGLITATLGLTSNGTVTVQNNSNFTQTGSGTFGTGTGLVSINGNLATSLIPNSTSYNLGSATNYWGAIYANNYYAPGTGVSGYWQRNLGALSPANITDDLLVGGTATASAKFQVLGTGASAGTVKIVAGQGIDTLAAGTLTIGGTTQTGLTLGRSGQSTTLAGNVQAFTLAGTITGSSSPNITSIGQFSGVTGVFSTSASSPIFQGNSAAVTFGNASYATTIAGSSTLTINPTSWTTTPTISGLITATLGLTANGAVTVASTFSQTGANTFSTGTGLVSINGNLATSLIPNSTSYNLGSATNYWGAIYANNYYSPGTGVSGYWQRNLGTLSPTNITDDVLVGGTATSSALVRLPGINNQNAWFNLGTGNVGIGTTNPGDKLDVVGEIDTSTYYKLGNSKILDVENVDTLLVGQNTGSSLVAGADYNTFVGQYAGYSANNASADKNVFLGAYAGYSNTSGYQNTFLGYNTGYGNQDGYYNVFIGVQAGSVNTSGRDNIFIGHSAGLSNTSGIANTYIGNNADGQSATNYSIVLSNGAGAQVTADHQLVVGGAYTNAYVTDSYWGSGVTDATPYDFTFNATGGSGTNIVGANLKLAGGKATGNAAGGNITFLTSDAGASGTTLQSLSEKMRITSTGNVGIGDVSPLSLLTVGSGDKFQVGTSGNLTINTGTSATVITAERSANGYVIETNVGGTPGVDIGTEAGVGHAVIAFKNTDILVGKNGTSGLAFGSGVGWADVPAVATDINIKGNVGIGTTGPARKLDVAGVIRNQTAADASPYTQERLSVYNDGSNWGYLGYGNDAQLRVVYSSTGGAHSMLWGTSSATDNTGTFTQTMSLSAAGNLAVSGTGNSTFAGNLGVEGYIYDITDTYVTINDDLQISGGDILDKNSTTSLIQIDSDGSNSVAFTGGNVGIGTLTPGTANLAVMGGNVGIGTTSPGKLLDVAGVIRSYSDTPQIHLYETDGAVDNKIWNFRVSGETLYGYAWNDAENSAYYWLKVDRTGTTIDYVSFPSNVGIGGDLTVSGGDITGAGSTAFHMGTNVSNRIEWTGATFYNDGTSSAIYGNLSGDVELNAINSSANSTITLRNSSASYVANVVVEGDLTVSGSINGSNVVPVGQIAAFAGSCPTGWTEYTAAQGRTVVGVPAAGTVAGTVGTALTNLENRTHTHTGPSHQHSSPFGVNPNSNGSGGRIGGPWNTAVFGMSTDQGTWPDREVPGAGNVDPVTGYYYLTSAAGTGATGTAATSNVIPYIQLRYCSKNAGADIAEWIPTSEDLTDKTIVSIDPDNRERIIASRKEYDLTVVGIISTQPGWLLGTENKESVQMALAGRVPASVTLKNGEIKPGDPITTSTIPGVGMKATKAGSIVGKAMEALNETSSLTDCYDQTTGRNEKCGIILVFVNISWYDPASDTSQDNLSADANNLFYEPLSFQDDLTNGDLVNLEYRYVPTENDPTELERTGYIAKAQLGSGTPVGVISTEIGGQGELLRRERINNKIISEIRLVSFGKTEVKIASSSASINPGDPITISSESGKGIKTLNPGPIIGRALEGWTSDSGKDRILTFVSPSWYDPSAFITDAGELGGIIPINTNTTNTTNKYQLVDKVGEAIDRFIYAGEAMLAELRAGLIQTQELFAEKKIVSPLVETGIISPLPDSSDVTIRLGRDVKDTPLRSGFGKLLIQNEQGETVASIDSEGNASFAGELRATQIDTDEIRINTDATVSGTLYADEIVTKHGKFGDLLANQITTSTINNIVQPEPTATPTPEPDQPEASESALLTDVQSWEISDVSQDLKITSNLKVLGRTSLADTSIAGSLNVDGTLVIADSSINSLSGTLYLQNLGLGGVDILAGKVVIDVDGNVQIAGNLAVGGEISASKLAINAKESEFGKLMEIKSPTGETLVSIDASGSAQFAQVETKKIIIANNSEQSTVNSEQSANFETNATAGKAILPAGETELQITNYSITNNSLIYLTPVSGTQNKVLYVKAKKGGEYFTAAIDVPIDSDIEFNWWIIN